MSAVSNKTERLHSLDSLRAIMMMLGIVLHASIAYIGGEPSFGWPMRDPNTESGFLLWLLLWIHNFRMPIFMFIAGFFAALLFYERSPGRMLKNRFDRLVLPFIVFLLILWPLVALAFSYSNAVFGYSGEIESAVGSMYINVTLASLLNDMSQFIPQSTMHLWFVYYLIFFSIVSFSLGALFKKLPKFSEFLITNTERLFQSPIQKVIVFMGITFFLLYGMDRSWVQLSTDFLPNIESLGFYFYFYICGWALFKAKHHLDRFMDNAWTYAIAGTVIFTVYHNIDPDMMSTEVHALIKSTTVWLFLFGFTGLFIKYFSHHSARMRYVSDSAYWVYLLHLPLTAFLPGVVGGLPLPDVVKFLLVVIGTGIVCFGTYHLFVRTSVIGQFLNGRKYTRKIADISDGQKASGNEPRMSH